MFEGVIIKETLTDELLLDHVTITKVAIWKTSNISKYWTVVWFESSAPDFPELLSHVMLDGWFADMKKGNEKYIVFKDTVLKYIIGNMAEKEAVMDECRKRGVPDEQMRWSE